MLLEFWKDSTDKHKAFGTLLTDLSKAFDCLGHDLLIADLHRYDILLQDYYSNRKQRTKEYFFLVPQKISYLKYHKALSWVLFSSMIYVGHVFILNTVYFTGYAYGNTNMVNYVPHVPSCLRSIRTSRAFACHALLRLMHLLALRPDVPYISPYLRVLHTLFACLKIFIEWICSLSKIFNFLRIIKGTTSCTVLMRAKIGIKHL